MDVGNSGDKFICQRGKYDWSNSGDKFIYQRGKYDWSLLNEVLKLSDSGHCSRSQGIGYQGCQTCGQPEDDH